MKNIFEKPLHFDAEDVGIENESKRKSKEKTLAEKLKNITKTAAQFVLGTALTWGPIEIVAPGTAERMVKEVEASVTYEVHKSESIRKKEERAKKVFGKYIISAKDMYMLQRTTLNEKKVAPEMILSNEPIQGINGSITKDILSSVLKEYPKGWVDDEIDSIFCSEAYTTADSGLKHRGLENILPLASTSVGVMGEGSVIKFYPAIKTQTISQINEVLAHELGHANDWYGDADLSTEDRFDMLLEVNDRMSADDKFYSYYVESINNEDEQLEQYLKCTEYWAEICAAYFTSPLILSADDFELVDQFVRKSDPDFDVNNISRKRILIERAASLHTSTSTDEHIDLRSHGPAPSFNTDPLNIEDINHSSWPELPPSNTNPHDDRN